MKICIDFDGTCVTNEFPQIGRDIGAVPVLQRLAQNGHQLILFTTRSDGGEYGDTLTKAVEWFEFNKIDLYGIQKDPEQIYWTDSPKADGGLYIDKAALGMLLKRDFEGEEWYIDWESTEKLLESKGLLVNEGYHVAAKKNNFRDKAGRYIMVLCPQCGRQNSPSKMAVSICNWCGCKERVE